MGSGTETSDQREPSHEVCFFLFVLFDKSIISSPLPGLWGQCNCSPNSALHPPPPGPSGFPLVPLPHSPSLCTPDNRPLGSSCMGPSALVRVDCCPTVQGSVPFVVLFSVNTRTERSQDQLTNRYEAKRQRQRFRGQPPERWCQGGRMPQVARPLNGWNQVFSHSLTLG